MKCDDWVSSVSVENKKAEETSFFLSFKTEKGMSKKEKKEKSYDLHHQIPDSLWWLKNEINLKLVEVLDHRRRHNRCWNDSPTEAICRVLKFNKSVRNPDFYAAIVWIILAYQDNYYKSEALKWPIKRESKTILDLDDDWDDPVFRDQK